MSTVDKSNFEKLTKAQLIDYITGVVEKFNEQVLNYNTLYTEYQKALEIKSSANSDNKQEDEILKLKEEIQTLKEEFDSLTQTNQSLVEEKIFILKENKELAENLEVIQKKFNSLNGKETDQSSQDSYYNNLIKENDELKNELMIIKSQKINKKLPDINALEKCSKINYIVQTYNVYGFENRVDNTEVYGGRQFIIASILIKLEDLKLTWNVDFKGSELFPSKKVIRTLTISREDFKKIKKSSLTKGMHLAIKDAFDIKDNFSPDVFFKSAVMVAGEVIGEDFKEIV